MSGGKGPFSYKETVSFKWSEPLLSDGFVPFPKRLMRCAPKVFTGKLRMSELSVMLAIVDYQRPLVSRKPSLPYLARAAGVTERRFRRCLRALNSRGLLDWSGSENAMDFNYDGLKRRIMRLTAKMEEAQRKRGENDEAEDKKSRD
jgi:hypothetical protein